MCVLTAEERAQYDDQLFDAPDQKKEAKVKRREIDLQVRRQLTMNSNHVNVTVTLFLLQKAI